MGRVDTLGSLLDYFAVTFGGKRDLPRVLGYKTQLTYDDYLARWARGDIAGRIVDIPAEATWDTLPRLTEDKKMHLETALSRKFQKIADKTKLRQKFEKADKLAGIGRYATVVLGFADGKPLDQPVKEGEGGELLFLQPFSEANAIPGDLDLNTKSPGFGYPINFAIDFERGLGESDPSLLNSLFGKLTRPFTSGRANKVHISRLVHVAEGTLEDDIYGMPRLRRVWDRLDDLAKITGGSAETFWLVANRGLQFNVDKDLALNAEDKEDLEEQFEEYEHGQRRMFRTRGVKIQGLNELGAGNVNPANVFRVVASQIVGATGIPYRMLFGTERGQNINAQDRRAWLEQVSARREGFANQTVLRALIERLVFAGTLPGKAEEAELFWPPVHDDMHQAEVADVVARAVYNVAKAMQSGFCPITTGEIRSTFLGLPPEMPEDAHDAKLAKDKAKADKAVLDAAKEKAQGLNGNDPASNDPASKGNGASANGNGASGANSNAQH